MELIPQVFVRTHPRSNLLAQVTPAQASKLQGEILKRTDWAVRTLDLYDIDGQNIGHVSQNGNVWLGKELIHNATGLVKCADGRWDIPQCAKYHGGVAA